MKRALVLLLIGLGIVGLSKLAMSRSSGARLKVARERIDAECKTFRDQPGHRQADICRVDPYAPKSFPMHREAKSHLDHARVALGRGDLRGAEASVGRAVAYLEPLTESGTTLAFLVRAALVKDILDLARDYHELDAARVLRGVRLQPSEAIMAESLQLRWSFAHWAEIPDAPGTAMSESERVEAIENASRIYQGVAEAMQEKDAKACEAASDMVGASKLLCLKLPSILETSARLEALQASSGR